MKHSFFENQNTKLKITVIGGTGTIGGHIASVLSHREEVSILGSSATSPSLISVQEKGFILNIKGEKESHIPPSNFKHITHDSKMIGKQDIIISTLRSCDLTHKVVVDEFLPLCHDETIILLAQNGIPCWFLAGLEGYEDKFLPSVDIDKKILNALGEKRIIGVVLFDIVNSMESNILTVSRASGSSVLRIGEFLPDNKNYDRCEKIRQLFEKNISETGGIKIEVTDAIRESVIRKLMVNMVNLPCAVMNYTIGEIMGDPRLETISKGLQRELMAIAWPYGISNFPIFKDIIERLKVKSHAHIPSMCRDIQQGRMTEVSGLYEALIELCNLLEDSSRPMTPILTGLKPIIENFKETSEKRDLNQARQDLLSLADKLFPKTRKEKRKLITSQGDQEVAVPTKKQNIGQSSWVDKIQGEEVASPTVRRFLA